MRQEVARRRAANRIGVTFEEYERRRAAGERWCTGHRGWCPADTFPGPESYCRAGRNVRERAYRDRLREEERNWLLARVLVK